MLKDKGKKNFFLMEWYPLLTFLIILFGYFTRLEIFTIVLNIILTSIAILTTDSMKPFLFFIMTFVYQMNPNHMPQKPYYSDYYYTGWRPYVLAVGALIMIASIFVFAFRNKKVISVNWLRVPLFVTLVVFSLAMLTNGLLFDGKNGWDLAWGFGQVVVYLLLFVVVYMGLRGENEYELVTYFSYLTLLASWIIILQVGELYLFGDAIVDGSIKRDNVTLGFGGCNIVGAHAAMLIPMNFYGYAKGKTPYLSLITAFAVYVAALASTSRNAMLFGSIFFVIFLVISMIASGRGKRLLISLGVIAVFLLALSAVFREELVKIIELYLNRGMGDNGRYVLWQRCWELFLENPVFGRGFYSLDISTPNSFNQFSFDLVPDFAHNTIFELLGATGAVGLVAYLIYRFSTLRLAFRKPSFDRTFLMCSAAFIVVASLVDNYIFQIFGPIYYTLATVIAVLIYQREMRIYNNKNCPIAHVNLINIKALENSLR